MPKSSCPSRSKFDYDLLMAGDGPTAIELARNNDIDVAVLDNPWRRRWNNDNESHDEIVWAVAWEPETKLGD